MTTDDTDPFEGRAYGDYVFRSRPDRNFFIGRLSPSQREKWLQEHPERWTSCEDALRELEARGRTEPARTSLTGQQPRWGLVAGPNLVCRHRVWTSGSPTRQQRAPPRSLLSILRRRNLLRSLLTTKSLSASDDLSASVALPQCWAVASARCSAGAPKGKALRAQR